MFSHLPKWESSILCELMEVQIKFNDPAQGRPQVRLCSVMSDSVTPGRSLPGSSVHGIL